MPKPTDSTLSEFVVLSVLAEASLSGSGIATRVAARSDDRLRLTPGVLSPLLAKPERAGCHDRMPRLPGLWSWPPGTRNLRCADSA